MVTPSSLRPDEVDSFEQAARDRPDDSPLAPPYDPGSGENDSRMSNSPSQPELTPTEELTQALHSHDRFRLKVMRKHLKWVRKQAAKHGISLGEVDAWRL